MKIGYFAFFLSLFFAARLFAADIIETITLNMALTEETQEGWGFTHFLPPRKLELYCFADKPSKCKYYAGSVEETVVNQPSFPQITWKYLLSFVHWRNGVLTTRVRITDAKNIPIGFGGFRINDQPFGVNSDLKIPFEGADALKIMAPVIDPANRRGMYIGVSFDGKEIPYK